MKHFNDCKEIFMAGVASVKPERLIADTVQSDGNTLTLGQYTIALNEVEHIYVVGAGKASGQMAVALETLLGERISDGLVIVKYGCETSCEHIRIVAASHPYPDQAGVEATCQLGALVDKATARDLVICLISGGGSALLADFPQGSSLAEIEQLSQALVKSAASISEINTVRKHLSNIKGGQLVRRCGQARVVSIILSDVPGDPLESIASGPTVPDTSTFGQALAVIAKYGLAAQIPPCLLHHLQQGQAGLVPETPKPGDPCFDNTTNILAGSNSIALKASREKAREMGYDTTIVTANLEGDTALIAQQIVKMAVEKQRGMAGRRFCMLFGGETTLTVSGSGIGGRNQHLALAAAIALQQTSHITLLAGGTDGNDGPTPAAGAIVDANTVNDGLSIAKSAWDALDRFDSYTYFRNTPNHLITGPTGTNVMDLVVVLG